MPFISQQQLLFLLRSAESEEARALVTQLMQTAPEPTLAEALATRADALSAEQAAIALEAVQRMFWRSAMGVLTLRLPSSGGVILSANPALSGLLELPPDALRGVALTTLLEIEEEELLRSAHEAIKGSVSLKLRTRAAPQRWLECELHAVMESAQLAGAALVARDITQQIEAAKQLTDEQRFVQVLQDSAPIAMCVTDEAGIYKTVNRAYCELYGYTEEELIGQPATIMVEEHERPRVYQAYKDFFAGRAPLALQQDWVVLRRDKSKRQIKLSNAMLELDDGRRYMVSNIVDVTEQRRGEELRTKLDARLAQSQKLESLGLLAGGIAHDFNNMITGILANAMFLRKSIKPNAEQYDALDDLEHTARRAASLIQTLTDYAGPRAATQSEQELGELVLDTLRLLRSSRSEVELLYHRPHGPLHVMMSASQLQQVILNLLINAIEASETCQSSVVSVSVEHRHVEELLLVDAITANPIEPGDYAVIVVQDWGVGISAEQQRVIFDPFFTTKAAGRGLGLASATSIIRAHSGAMLLQSMPGIGTRFELLLPIFSVRLYVNE